MCFYLYVSEYHRYNALVCFLIIEIIKNKFNFKKNINMDTISAQKVEFYELEKAKFIVKDACGLDIAYAYEDLVFAEHGVFILQFQSENTDSMLCWFNTECNESDRIALFDSLCVSAKLNSTDLIYKGNFEMIQNVQEQIDLKFMVL